MADKRQTNIKDVKSQMKEVKTELKDGVFIYTGPMTIAEFANKIQQPANEIIKHFFMQGKMYNLNMTLDEEQIGELCMEYEYDFQQKTEVNASNFMEEMEVEEDSKNLQDKPPIVTIMGHVDHGKTTLIDNIRNANVAEGEAGGITQHTGAYQIEHENKKITFLDTPGHEAFTAMRSRGAKVTDIVVIVVAAEDGVMPQTKEAIDHSKAAKVPIIVFVNKMDKPGANADKVKADLSAHDVIADDWGGDVQFVYGSGLTGMGIPELFNAINLEAEMLELKANPDRLPMGTVVEAHLDKGRGSVATIIVETGTIMPRDFIVAGAHYGRVRTLQDTTNEKIESAGPGTPVIITGLNYTPSAGDRFVGFKDEKFAKALAQEKAFVDKQQELKARNAVHIEDGVKVLNIIVKSDVQGTAEAVKYSLGRIANEEVVVNIVRASVGAITKSDILLAQASNSIIYGFNIRPTGDVKQFAEQEKIIVKTHTIIYKMIEEVEAILKGMLAPKFEEKVIGQAKIIKVIFSSKVGNIAGSLVIDGVVKSGSKMRLIRDGRTIHEGILDSLQRGPDQAKKVELGKEFGTHIKKFNDIREEDVIECYEDVEIEVK
ncbi:translation initiation factor IF-2 [Mycoplasma marinum]|uniref:Translation initiation factor IF-2 n=1 Tax=Mycoplasma marinum TaxID=1937190 RepID=A0A4R0XXY4_9MOLU|nr:translation initiation factor IF-2 [Mycoplasma marinum]TCG11907.1 translation initiation factor IF-2 [Mycoplasma marinum]